MNPLAGKTALVTGGGSGMGLAIARALAQEGCRVAICGRTEQTLRQAAESCSPPAQLSWRVCDVADRAQVHAMFEWLHAQLGPLDILVNSAGTNVAHRLWENVDPKDFDRVVAANLTGTFNCMHVAWPDMRSRGSGQIVNIVSIAGKRVLTLAGLPYCAAKFGQSALGTFANLEASQYGIRVTNIYPGEVNTPIIDKRPEVPPPEKRAQMLQPEDIAACVLAILKLPPRAVVSELVITPPYQPWS